MQSNNVYSTLTSFVGYQYNHSHSADPHCKLSFASRAKLTYQLSDVNSQLLSCACDGPVRNCKQSECPTLLPSVHRNTCWNVLPGHL